MGKEFALVSSSATEFFPEMPPHIEDCRTQVRINAQGVATQHGGPSLISTPTLWQAARGHEGAFPDSLALKPRPVGGSPPTSHRHLGPSSSGYPILRFLPPL